MIDKLKSERADQIKLFAASIHDGGKMTMTREQIDAAGLADRIGSLAEGLEADLIALDGNPLDHITADRRVVFVMKHGKVYKDAPPARSH